LEEDEEPEESGVAGGSESVKPEVVLGVDHDIRGLDVVDMIESERQSEIKDAVGTKNGVSDTR
jgi:hypothetical protein